MPDQVAQPLRISSMDILEDDFCASSTSSRMSPSKSWRSIMVALSVVAKTANRASPEAPVVKFKLPLHADEGVEFIQASSPVKSSQ